MKIPTPDLETKVLLASIAVMALALLRLTHVVHFSEPDDISVLALLAILLANFVVRSRHAAAGTSISCLCFGLLCLGNPLSGGSIYASITHFFLLGFFGLGFAAYGYAAFRTYLRPKRAATRPAAKPGMPMPTPPLGG